MYMREWNIIETEEVVLYQGSRGSDEGKACLQTLPKKELQSKHLRCCVNYPTLNPVHNGG